MKDKTQIANKPSWTEEILDETGLLIVCGIWLIFAPAALGYTGRDVAVSDLAVGLVLIVLPVWHIIRRYRDHVALFFTGILGFWLIISGIILEGTSKSTVNEIFVGVVVIVLTARITYASHTSSA